MNTVTALMLATVRDYDSGGTWYTFASSLAQIPTAPPLVDMIYIDSTGKAWAMPLTELGYTQERYQQALHALTMWTLGNGEEEDLTQELVPFTAHRSHIHAQVKKLDEVASDGTGQYL